MNETIYQLESCVLTHVLVAEHTYIYPAVIRISPVVPVSDADDGAVLRVETKYLAEV